MQKINISIIVLSISILLAAWMVSNAIKNYMHLNAGFPSVVETHNNDKYELIVNDGWLYLYDKSDGQIYKKPDTSDSSWETVKYYTED
ncbi:MAG: hypothetical protein C0P75_009595 [Bacilli bacterium]|uniref:hypothetical protein n=1 Tax=unclassified Ureibacillus TaxID=2638520 RepID=UPI001EB31D40|nr:hypothetical protein [Bacilli bacterium]